MVFLVRKTDFVGIRPPINRRSMNRNNLPLIDNMIRNCAEIVYFWWYLSPTLGGWPNFAFFWKSACGEVTIVAKWPQKHVIKISAFQLNLFNLQQSFKARKFSKNFKKLKKKFLGKIFFNGINLLILTQNDHWRYFFVISPFFRGFQKNTIFPYFL